MTPARRRRGRLSTLVSSLLAVAVVLLMPFALLNLAGGGWEQWSGFDRLAGPRRFQEYLGQIPSGVTALRGGFRSSRHGPVSVRFHYEPPLARLSLLQGFTEMDGGEAPLRPAPFAYTRAFRRPSKKGSWEYLLFDERTNDAMFYLPGDHG